MGPGPGAAVLSTVLIVRNEAPRLGAALASIGRFGEVLVCDTGSTDSTIDVALCCGARVTEIAWSGDFAQARTLAQAEARHDWVMRMDADELLSVRVGTPEGFLTHAVEAAERAEADCVYVLRRYSATNLHWFPRIFRASRHRWVHPLHERTIPIGERRGCIAVPGAVFLHRPASRPRGYADAAGRHLARHPEDPHLRYYFARSLWEEGRWTEAAVALRSYLSGASDYRFHRGEAHRMLGTVLAANDPDDALRHMAEAAMGDGVRAEAIASLVELHLRRCERAAARRWIRRAGEARPPRERAPWGGTTQPYLLEEWAWKPSTWRAYGRAAA